MKAIGLTSILDGIAYQQFGHEVLCTQVRFATLEAFFEIDPDVQRKLDVGRRAEIRRFIIDSLEKDVPFYFSPFIFSARQQITKVADGFELQAGSKLYILDGQHRQSALSSAINTLQNQLETAQEYNRTSEATQLMGYIDSLRNYPVAMQIYLDLSTQQERQLFTDYNTERKDAHSGLMLQYDLRDAYSKLTMQVVNQLQQQMDIEMTAVRISERSSAITTVITMKKCLLALFEGILTVKTGEPDYRYCEEQEVVGIAKSFFECWVKVFPKSAQKRNQYVTGLSGIQIALALTIYQLVKDHQLTYQQAISQLKHIKKSCSWRHDDPFFLHMYNTQKERLDRHSSATSIKRTAQGFVAIIQQGG